MQASQPLRRRPRAGLTPERWLDVRAVHRKREQATAATAAANVRPLASERYVREAPQNRGSRSAERSLRRILGGGGRRVHSAANHAAWRVANDKRLLADATVAAAELAVAAADAAAGEAWSALADVAAEGMDVDDGDATVEAATAPVLEAAMAASAELDHARTRAAEAAARAQAAPPLVPYRPASFKYVVPLRIAHAPNRQRRLMCCALARTWGCVGEQSQSELSPPRRRTSNWPSGPRDLVRCGAHGASRPSTPPLYQSRDALEA